MFKTYNGVPAYVTDRHVVHPIRVALYAKGRGGAFVETVHAIIAVVSRNYNVHRYDCEPN